MSLVELADAVSLVLDKSGDSAIERLRLGKFEKRVMRDLLSKPEVEEEIVDLKGLRSLLRNPEFWAFCSDPSDEPSPTLQETFDRATNGHATTTSRILAEAIQVSLVEAVFKSSNHSQKAVMAQLLRQDESILHVVNIALDSYVVLEEILKQVSNPPSDHALQSRRWLAEAVMLGATYALGVRQIKQITEKRLSDLKVNLRDIAANFGIDESFDIYDELQSDSADVESAIAFMYALGYKVTRATGPVSMEWFQLGFLMCFADAHAEAFQESVPTFKGQLIDLGVSEDTAGAFAARCLEDGFELDGLLNLAWPAYEADRES